MIRKALMTVLFLMASIASEAVSVPYNFKHLFVKDGLSSGDVYSVRQDTHGQIWIATVNGVSVYNGYDIVSYELESSAPHDSEGNNDRQWLFGDSMGNVWASYESLALYDRTCDSIMRLEWFPDAVVTDYLEVDRVLFTATDSGLFAIDMERRIPCSVPDGLSTLSPLKFCNRGNEIVMYTRDERIVIYDTVSDSVSSNRSCPFPNRVADIECDREGQVWIATNGDGLYCIDENGALEHYTISDGLVNSNYVRALSLDTDSMLWVGTGNGLSIIDTYRKKSAHMLYDRSQPNGISNNSITGIYRSRDGGMWLSNMGHGVDYFYKENNHFQNVEIDGIPEVVIGGAAEDRDGSIWIGTSRYGAFHLNPSTGRMSQVVLSDDPVKNDIKDIAFSGDGRYVYFCTARYGFNIFDRISGQVENFSVSPYPKVVSSIIVENERYLWIGTHDGVFLFDVVQKKVVSATPDGISLIYCMFRDASGRFWLGTETALISCDMTISPSGIPEVNNILTNADISKIQDIHEEGGRIYVATTYGLYCRIPSDEWKLYSIQDGLPSNKLRCLESDSQGRIWIGTEDGLSCFDPVNSSFANFYGENGLSCSVFRKGASLVSKSGIIYMGGFDGLVKFDPSGISNRRYAWAPMVSGIYSMGERILPDKDGRVVLEPHQRSISMTFAVPDYTSSGRNVFAFRLLPKNDNWTSSAQRTVYFSDLRAGEYTLELALYNGSGIVEQNGRYTLEVIVAPYWYEIMAVKIMFILLALSAIAYLTYSLVARQKRKNKVEIDKIRTESTAALDYRQARFYAKGILSAEDSRFLNKVIADVERNLQNGSFSVETLAGDMCTCRSNLYRKIMSITGDTVQNLIKRIRLEKAIQLIEENRYSISQISEMVGFSSISYFVTCFKEYTGRTPGNTKRDA